MEYWKERDPLIRSERLIRDEGLLGDAEKTERALAGFGAEADEIADTVRERLAGEDELDPRSLFTDVYATVPPLLERERATLADELREV